MKPNRKLSLKQPTPKELTDACLEILRSKFYGRSPEEMKAFAQDRMRLLKWVVLWPAAWLNDKAVTIHGDKYREIFVKVFIQAATHVESKVKYRPAYLRQVIQSHFKIHGEAYYEEAKAVRSLADQALLLVGKMPVVQTLDPVRQMADAARLIKPVKKQAKTVFKRDQNLQLNLG